PTQNQLWVDYKSKHVAAPISLRIPLLALYPSYIKNMSGLGGLPLPSLPRFEVQATAVTAWGREAMVEQSEDGDNDGEMTYEYVTHVKSSCDGSKLAAAISTREVKLYARDTLHFEQAIAGHEGPVTQLSFSALHPHIMHSCAEDGFVRCWDTRTMEQALRFGVPREEIWSMAVAQDDHTCAVGKEGSLEFYDLRKAGAKIGAYSDCHTDAITQVVWHPAKPMQLVTASEDGLMCLIDTAISSEEEALESVMNAECPVRTVGFYGPHRDHLFCCTNTETLSLWHPQDAQRIADLRDIRAVSRGCGTGSGGGGEAGELGGPGTATGGAWGEAL
ncbi:unnamed protein product, partial [Choristocarpus tenellus]